MIPDSTPIDEALRWLRNHTRLTDAEYTALVETLPSAYRTLGDLPHAVTRGEVDAKLAKKLTQVLKA